MSTKFLRNSLALICLIFCVSAFAQSQDGSIPILQKGLVDALSQVSKMLQNVTVKWLGVFMILQFTWTNFNLLINDADITKVFAKFAGSIFWFCICIYIFMNGSDFLTKISQSIMQLATGSMGVTFDPVQPIHTGLNVGSQLLVTLNSAKGGILQSLNPFPSIMMGLVSVVILAVSALLAFKILMVFIETKMVIALSPLSFSLLGLNAFRDQGLAPFKYLVSMGIRMFLYGAVLAAMEVFSVAIMAEFKALPGLSDASVWPPIWAAAMGYLILGAVAMRVDSIAVMLASGSSQMSTGDAAAVGAAAGAAAGIATSAAAGVATTAGGAASGGGQLMSEFMKNMMGAGSVSNAGQNGAGGVSKPDSGAPKQSMAPQGGGGGGGGGGAQGEGGGLPDPRARSAPAGDNTAAGGARVLGMGTSGVSDAEIAAVAEAGARVPEATTSVWQSSGDRATQVAGAGPMAGEAPVRAADSSGSGGGNPGDGSGTSAKSGGGDNFGANAKKKMSQAQGAEMAQQSTPRKPTVADAEALSKTLVDGSSGSGGSSETAAIGDNNNNNSNAGSSEDVKNEIARMADQMAKMAAPRKQSPTIRTEDAGAVHIQMNTHHSD